MKPISTGENKNIILEYEAKFIEYHFETSAKKNKTKFIKQ